MANVTINQLTAIDDANLADELALYDVSTNSTKKVTIRNIKGLTNSYTGGNGITITGQSIASNNSNLVNGTQTGSLKTSNATAASNLYAFAQGQNTTASGQASHAAGTSSSASGNSSYAGGTGTLAQGNSQTAIGKYNVGDQTSLFIVGNGSSAQRSNALTLDQNGNLEIAGSINDEALLNTSLNNNLGDPINNPGTITLSHEDSPGIYFENTTDNYNKKIIYTKSGAGQSSVGGQILVMNGGGVTIVGGGQSGDTTYSNLTDTGYNQQSQSLLLTADTNVGIITGAQNWDERKAWTFATTGNTTFPGNLYLKGHNYPVGYLMTVSNTSAVSVPNQTSKAVASITLTPGTWILQCHVHFPGNATGIRRVNLSGTSGSTADYMQVSALPGNFRTPVTFTHMTYISENSYTYYLNVQHTAGTTLSIAAETAQIRAIQIA